MDEFISTGSEALNELIRGYENDIITTLYGPGGSGKTNFCMVCAVSVARKGKKVIYVDTEGGFSLTRLKQLIEDYDEVLSNMIFIRPTSFEKQKKAFEDLGKFVNSDVGVIIIDSIAMLYRLELGQSEKVYEVNRELGRQIAQLTEIARTRGIPVLITNQVYTSFDERDKTHMVGGDILKYGSKCIIELKKQGQKRQMVLRKHRSIAEDEKINFKIIDKGIIKEKFTLL